MQLPTQYEGLDGPGRREARNQYAILQKGLCQFCKTPLIEEPKRVISKYPLTQEDRQRFPEGFFNYPHHLHHDHDTGMTIGVLHAYCNAVSFIYFES